MSNINLGRSLKIDRDYLCHLPSPQPMGRFHRPLRFDELVNTLDDVFHPAEIRLGINSNDTKLFGLLKLDDQRALGFRSSTNQSMALRLAAGTNVFVCDNMILSGNEWCLNRHHTLRLNLLETLLGSLGDILARLDTFERSYQRLKDEYLSDNEASAIMIHAIRFGAFPANDMKAVADIYFSPDPSPESVGFSNTKWSLLQAFTRVMRTHPEQVKFARTLAIGKMMGL